jgi:serine/threonine protein kinase
MEMKQGAGTLPYWSPEMFRAPEKISYPTDIWSLGVCMFESVTGKRPFEAEGDSLLGSVIADLLCKAPNVLDSLNAEDRSKFDNNLARVIAKSLEKDVTDRYKTVDEIYNALYACLIKRGEATYSVFLSYRVASEAPLARLIFDELNHTTTPGGHRVTIYFDAHRLVKGENWEDGFTQGILNSVCIFHSCPTDLLPLLLSCRKRSSRSCWPAAGKRIQQVVGDCLGKTLTRKTTF